MISFCIKNNNPKATKYIMDSISSSKIDGIIFCQKKFSKYSNIILHYVNGQISEFYNELSNIICNCILDIYEPIIIRNIILSEYFYFDISEMSSIESNCFENLKIGDSKSINHFFNNAKNSDYIDRKKSLLTSISKYITSSKSIVLDGFIRFRIKDYISIIEESIDSAVNQYVIDKEYTDFINIIKLYISSKPSLYNKVYLIYNNGESTLLNENKEIINCQKMNLDYSFLSDISFSSNDYTLNSLLYLLPSELIINLLSPEDEFINTLKLIFSDRVHVYKNNQSV